MGAFLLGLILTALLPAAKTLDVDFDDSDLGIGKMLRNPIGRDQRLRMSVICHASSLMALLYSTCYIVRKNPDAKGTKKSRFQS